MTAAQTGSSASTSSGSITTTNATDLLFGANYIYTGTTGAGSGFTNRIITLPDGDIVEDEMVTAIGSYSATAPLSSSGWWVMQMAAFRAASNGTSITSPTVPGNLSATACASQINLAWTPSTSSIGVAGYHIYRNGTQVGTTAATAYSDTGLKAATAYTYTIAAYDKVGNVSGQSAPASASTSGTAHTPVVVSFTATATAVVTGQAITLSWSVTGTPSPSLSINNGVGTVTGKTSIAVSPTSTTTYALTATNSAGSASTSLTVTVAADATPPSQPTDLAATTESPSTINLSWTASTDNVGVVGYLVYRNGARIATTAAPSYADTGLAPSTTFTYAIAAYDAHGNVSTSSASASATTLAGPSLAGCPVFPSNNVWNMPVKNLPVDPNSSMYIETIGSSAPLRADFSSVGGGIPYNLVSASQPMVTVDFSDNSQGDPGPYPIPSGALVESGGTTTSWFSIKVIARFMSYGKPPLTQTELPGRRIMERCSV